uniref:Uncharacterized protein n=1 Tax=Flavobacterium psychrophilum TaxID=96345 RepID=Q8GRB6_FLAPS|nr:hypothetical protein [Flavobacterium psychrophilum]
MPISRQNQNGYSILVNSINDTMFSVYSP